MKFTEVCRVCLATKSLNPIFVNPENHTRTSAAIFVTTGLKVYLNDGLPQQMCSDCVNYLNELLKFQKKCKDIEKELLKYKDDFKNNGDNKSDILYTPKSSYSNKPKLKLSPTDCISVNELDSYIENADSKYDDKQVKDDYIKVEYIPDYIDDNSKPHHIINEFDKSDEGNAESIVLFIDSPNEDSCRDEDLVKLNTNDASKLKTEHSLSNDTLDIEIPFEFDFSDKKHKRVTCKICGKNLSIRSIDFHITKRHPGKDYRKVKCDLCDKYILREKMNRHKVLMHASKSQCFRCCYCKTEFNNKDVLVEHVASCTAKNKKRKVYETGRELIECDVCKKTMQKASLRMHKAVKHSGLGPVCEHCGKRFGNKFRLNEHYRAKHDYEKFKCSYCEFQSASVMAMRNHERRHRGEKPFVCENCGAKFHAAYLLAQHKQSHRTQRLMKCDLCSATFKANNSLHMHKITCHSKSMYKCSMCDRTYSCRHYVVKHLRHFHEYRGPVGALDKIETTPGVRGDEE